MTSDTSMVALPLALAPAKHVSRELTNTFSKFLQTSFITQQLCLSKRTLIKTVYPSKIYNPKYTTIEKNVSICVLLFVYRKRNKILSQQFSHPLQFDH